MDREMIQENAIRLNVEASDWEAAVRLCGGLLVEAGKAKSTYVEAIVNAIKELGPYILIAPGVALPHARPEDGVISEGISIVVLKEEVAFEPGKEIKVLIGLAAKDKESHLDILQKIAEVISKESTIEQMKNATKTEEIMALFN